jgi:prophage regulatory protein
MEKLLRLPDVMAATGWSEPTIYRLMKHGRFPRPVKLIAGGRAIGWPSSQIEAIVAERIAERDAGGRPA